MEAGGVGCGLDHPVGLNDAGVGRIIRCFYQARLVAVEDEDVRVFHLRRRLSERSMSFVSAVQEEIAGWSRDVDDHVIELIDRRKRGPDGSMQGGECKIGMDIH